MARAGASSLVNNKSQTYKKKEERRDGLVTGSVDASMMGMIVSVKCRYFSGSKILSASFRWGSALRSASTIIYLMAMAIPIFDEIMINCKFKRQGTHLFYGYRLICEVCTELDISRRCDSRLLCRNRFGYQGRVRN